MYIFCNLVIYSVGFQYAVTNDVLSDSQYCEMLFFVQFYKTNSSRRSDWL